MMIIRFRPKGIYKTTYSRSYFGLMFMSRYLLIATGGRARGWKAWIESPE